VLPIVLLLLLGLGAGVFLASRAVYRAVQKAAGNAGGITTVTPADFPPRPAMRQLEPGVQFCEISRGDVSEAGLRLWLYLPGGANTPHPPSSLPCVLVAPAGSNLIVGMDLGDGDRAEQLPYVRAGYAVMAYELDGHVPGGMQSATELQTRKAIRQFMRADAGQANAKAAIDYLLAKVPEVDPSRIYAAGHSSAGTLAVQLSVNEPRLRGAIAYAPCTDVEARLGSNLSKIDRAVPGARDFVRRNSPKNLGPPRCPLLVFHARDDSNVPVAESESYAASHNNVTLVTVATGGHHGSMITQGVPRGLAWLQSQGANPSGNTLAANPPQFSSGRPIPPNLFPPAGLVTPPAPPAPVGPPAAALRPAPPPANSAPPAPTTDPDGNKLSPFPVDADLAAQLGAATRIGPYTMRPPADFQRSGGKDGDPRATWVLRQPGKRATATLSIIVSPRTDMANAWPVVVTDAGALRRTRPAHVEIGADVSYGTINGRPFIRTERLTKTPGGQVSRFSIHYLAFDGPNYISIQLAGDGADPHVRDLAEAAVRSMK
jgi:dienelactone hydrolase